MSITAVPHIPQGEIVPEATTQGTTPLRAHGGASVPAGLTRSGATRGTYVDVPALKRAHPLDDVVGRYGVTLRPSGRALVGLCPIHGDRDKPNLYVYLGPNPEDDNWYCYRCAIGGDVIAFVQWVERLSFVEACARLDGSLGIRPDGTPHGGGPASQTSVAPPTTAPPATAPGPAASVTAGETRDGHAYQRRARSEQGEWRWDRLPLEAQEVMNLAGAVYQRLLWQTPRALAYLRARGIPDQVARDCRLGYADGRTLESLLRRHGRLRLAEQLGLLVRCERADGTRPLREVFAGRIIVPEVRCTHFLWFIGRTLDDHPVRPRFLALGGERPVLGYERAAGQRQVLLCEGVFDYLTAISWGLAAFSPCGTHLPPKRLGFLAQATAVYGAFDGDSAGRDASLRFAEFLGRRWRPLVLPEGHDLNDLGRHVSGRETFLRLLSDAGWVAAVEQEDGDLHQSNRAPTDEQTTKAQRQHDGAEAVPEAVGSAEPSGGTNAHRT